MDNQTQIAGERLTALRNELRAGESILWHSIQHPRLIGSSTGIWLFAIPWTGFALFWMVTAFWITRSAGDLDDPVARFFPLFGLPFLAIGIWMLAMPVLKYIAAKRTVFAVTNERIIRLMKGKGILMEWVPASRISKVTKTKRKGPHGTLKVKLKGKASEFEPSGKHFVIADIEHPDIAKRFIHELGELVDED